MPTHLKLALTAAFLGLAFPAQASVTDRVVLEVRPSAKFKVLDSGAGFQTLLIASNTVFDVSIAGVLGEVSIDVSTAGQVGGKAYGAGAQTPGAVETVTQVGSPFGTVIYTSDRATAAQPGTLWDQAVHLTISYDPIADPRISVEPQG